MTTMRFMSTLAGQPTKFVKFDSSPGRAIAKKLGDGMWDERSYESRLVEELPGGDQVYEIRLRRAETDSNPGPHPLEKVGILRYEPATVR